MTMADRKSDDEEGGRKTQRWKVTERTVCEDGGKEEKRRTAESDPQMETMQSVSDDTVGFLQTGSSLDTPRKPRGQFQMFMSVY